MSEHEHDSQLSQVERIENLVEVLRESSIGELALVENGVEIIIRRQLARPIATLEPQVRSAQVNVGAPSSRAGIEDRSVAIVAPLTGIFYISPSPTLPPFVAVGDIIQSGQVVGLIEAMKVFNEIQADTAGRLVQISAEGGKIVKKGDVLLRVEPL